MLFLVDTKDIIRFEKDLKRLNKKGLPFATRNTLNSLAFEARRNALGIVEKEFVERNRFTARSLRVEKAVGLNINRQESFMGSTASYMEIQEFGGTLRKKGRVGRPIPTSFSSGEGRSSTRRRLVRSPNKFNRTLSNIRSTVPFLKKISIIKISHIDAF